MSPRLPPKAIPFEKTGEALAYVEKYLVDDRPNAALRHRSLPGFSGRGAGDWSTSFSVRPPSGAALGSKRRKSFLPSRGQFRYLPNDGHIVAW
jgi:hypothetical protein